MGAETRAMLQSILDTNSLYKAALNLVADKKHDAAIKLYMQWRVEHDALELYERGESDGGE